MHIHQFKKLKIPDSPGVYSFKKDGQTLYIGKATSLRERLRSYFNPDLIKTRGQRITNMVQVADIIEFERADSVLEAFIRETELIKKYQPIANSMSKDNKSFNYVIITDEAFPRVLINRGRDIEKESELKLASPTASGSDVLKYRYIFGPYPYGAELKEAMRIVRKIFPYRDTCMPAEEYKEANGKDSKPKPCFNAAIGLCPGVCTGAISRTEYLKIINNIRLFFQGKKGKIVAALKKQMMDHAKKQEFELANEVKHTLYSLEHIKDISMIKRDVAVGVNNGDAGQERGLISVNTATAGHMDGHMKMRDQAKRVAKAAGKVLTSLVSDWSGETAERLIRIESYDIAHMSGKNMVGVMCVSTDSEFDKSQYRKFIIQNFDKSNDTGALKEVLTRRFNHHEWRAPDIVVIDGGQAQLNAAYQTIKHVYAEIEYEKGLVAQLPYIISVVKDDAHKAKDILYADQDTQSSSDLESDIKQYVHGLASKEHIISLNAETHRFAITFHKKKRHEDFLPGKKRTVKKKIKGDAALETLSKNKNLE